METQTVSYYNGSSARPFEVRVLLFNEAVHLYNGEDDSFLASYPLKQTHDNKIGSTHFLYLDPSGLQYLQIQAGHPLLATLEKEAAESKLPWARKLMKQRLIVLVAFLFALIIGFYFLIISLVPWLGTRIISKEREMILGEQLMTVMMEESKLMGQKIDPAATQRLRTFAGHLKLSDDYPIKVTVVNSKIVNAYALPGGNIVVYSGLLEKIRTPEALAALLAHESTHVNERHSLRSMLRSVANGLIVAVIFGDATGISTTLVGNAEALNGLSYSRSLETEADTKGMELLLHNNVQAKGMRELMQTLQKEEGNVPGELGFLSSHPLTKKRIRSAQEFIRKHPQQIETRPELVRAFDALKR